MNCMNQIDFTATRNIDEILSRLTIEAKIGQLHQSGSYEAEEKQLLQEGNIGSLLNFCGTDAVSEIQNIIMNSISEIPLLIGDDVIHGYSTGFPIPLAESCSFDLALMEESAAIAAKEAASQGVNLIFAPMVDVCRDPRWGRIAEGAGEDAFYGSLVARARVRGIQRKNADGYPQAAACPKHFVGYGASEGGRDYDYTEVSDVSLYNTYLPPFRAAVSEGALAVMSGFNDLSGRPVSASRYIIDEVLRNTLGFDGMVVSDWESVQHAKAHGVAADDSGAALLGIMAGVDLDMHSQIYRRSIHGLLEEGRLTMEEVDRSVRRVLEIKHRLGLFDPKTWRRSSPEQLVEDGGPSVLRLPEHQAIAREMAVRSMVLLKNEADLLPLRESTTSMAVIGELAISKDDPLGCWQCKTDSAHVVSILQGITERAGASCTVHYAGGCHVPQFTDTKAETGNDAMIREAADLAARCDVAVVVLGEACWMSGENNSRAYLDLPVSQKDLFRQVVRANPQTILLLMNGRPLTIPEEDAMAGAVLEVWQPGDETGHAVADILFGDRNPSGRLTVTFPRTVGQIPLYYNRRNSGRPELIRYIDEKTGPLYPFGYGLSYSCFGYSAIRLSDETLTAGGSMIASVDVTNESGPAGREVVQMYIQDVVSSVTRPAREFKGFVALDLEPGETKTATFEITQDLLAYYGHDRERHTEEGVFRVWIGKDSTCTAMREFEFVGLADISAAHTG
jgi:beta-glucosidase